MSHDIDQTTGKAAIAWVEKKPWHGLGQELPAGAGIEVWLKEARLEWELERLPVQYLAGGELHTMDRRHVLARSDTREGLSLVSDEYRVVQPREVLEFYRSLVAECGYELETAGALDHGRKVRGLARTGTQATVDKQGEDEVAAYVPLATSCDKSLATTAAFTSIRVVCQNTLFFASEDIRRNRRPQVKVPHQYRFDAERVIGELGLMDRSWKGFMGRVREMAGLGTRGCYRSRSRCRNWRTWGRITTGARISGLVSGITGIRD